MNVKLIEDKIHGYRIRREVVEERRKRLTKEEIFSWYTGEYLGFRSCESKLKKGVVIKYEERLYNSANQLRRDVEVFYNADGTLLYRQERDNLDTLTTTSRHYDKCGKLTHTFIFPRRDYDIPNALEGVGKATKRSSCLALPGPDSKSSAGGARK